MILKRCPSCRGFCDVEVSPRCFACGAVLSGDLPKLTRRPPPALRAARKDAKTSSFLLSFFGVLGTIGAVLLVITPMDGLPRFGIAAFLLVALILGVLSKAGAPGSATSVISKGMFKLLALFGMFIALLIGLFLLLLFACAVGAFK